MAHKRINQLTVSGEGAKHLRPNGRRAFWKAERKAFQSQVRAEAITADATEYDRSTVAVRVHDLIAGLVIDGWFLVRQKGSHRQFHHRSKRGTVTVAGKPSVEVPPGTLNSILEQASLKK